MRTPWCSCVGLWASVWSTFIYSEQSPWLWDVPLCAGRDFGALAPGFHICCWGQKDLQTGVWKYHSTSAVPILSELATLFLRMYIWAVKSIWNCFWFLDLYFFFNHFRLIALSQQLFLRWAFCQFYSLVNCINHTARLRSQQLATRAALKSRTFLNKHIHLFVRTDGSANPAFVHSSERAVSP